MRSPEKGRWEIDEGGSQYRTFNSKPAFNLLLDKYTRQAAVSKNRPKQKHPRSPPREEMDKIQQREVTL
jgi:hypothetical protein